MDTPQPFYAFYLPTYPHSQAKHPTLKMHFSALIPIILFATSAAAVPATPASPRRPCDRSCNAARTSCGTGWISEQFGSCWACCKAEMSIDPVPEPEAENQICLRMCHHKATQCEAGWVSKHMGDCWTCCKA
ncbi:hypothetical protein GMOD_00008696 [Pyrenophora seminiperda CCB06]|uniref:Uncharacterized protein n=1 Tax=Pyrenophora seminiperda CCB06 TaxID=1302712 RepID=A0A3M7M5Q1_9PLEO|nr:hypothetical protein GMOD_00008696 [Pyrenophora seminiperda CCB06]